MAVTDDAWVRFGLSRVPGTRSEGFLKLGAFPDGSPLGSPVIVLAGREPGPTLWVQASVHGSEVGGIVGLHRFLEKIDPNVLKGTIVAVPAANPLALRGQSRNTPLDGENLNRNFPGSAHGTHTLQVAHHLLEAASSVADFVVDLHSGGDRSHVPHYALYWAHGSETAAKAGLIAEAADVPYVWASIDPWLSKSMMAVATERGLPTIILECGGAGQVPEEHVWCFARSLQSVAAALRLIAGAPVRRAVGTVERCTLVYNTVGGLFEHFVTPGSVVAREQPLGRVVDLFGRTVETITAPVGPAYIAAIRKNWAAVTSGEMLAECVEFAGKAA